MLVMRTDDSVSRAMFPLIGHTALRYEKKKVLVDYLQNQILPHPDMRFGLMLLFGSNS